MHPSSISRPRSQDFSFHSGHGAYILPLPSQDPPSRTTSSDTTSTHHQHPDDGNAPINQISIEKDDELMNDLSDTSSVASVVVLTPPPQRQCRRQNQPSSDMPPVSTRHLLFGVSAPRNPLENPVPPKTTVISVSAKSLEASGRFTPDFSDHDDNLDDESHGGRVIHQWMISNVNPATTFISSLEDMCRNLVRFLRSGFRAHLTAHDCRRLDLLGRCLLQISTGSYAPTGSAASAPKFATSVAPQDHPLGGTANMTSASAKRPFGSQSAPSSPNFGAKSGVSFPPLPTQTHSHAVDPSPVTGNASSQRQVAVPSPHTLSGTIPFIAASVSSTSTKKRSRHTPTTNNTHHSFTPSDREPPSKVQRTGSPQYSLQSLEPLIENLRQQQSSEMMHATNGDQFRLSPPTIALQRHHDPVRLAQPTDPPRHSATPPLQLQDLDRVRTPPTRPPPPPAAHFSDSYLVDHASVAANVQEQIHRQVYQQQHLLHAEFLKQQQVQQQQQQQALAQEHWLLSHSHIHANFVNLSPANVTVRTDSAKFQHAAHQQYHQQQQQQSQHTSLSGYHILVPPGHVVQGHYVSEQHQQSHSLVPEQQQQQQQLHRAIPHVHAAASSVVSGRNMNRDAISRQHQRFLQQHAAQQAFTQQQHHQHQFSAPATPPPPPPAHIGSQQSRFAPMRTHSDPNAAGRIQSHQLAVFPIPSHHEQRRREYQQNMAPTQRNVPQHHQRPQPQHPAVSHVTMPSHRDPMTTSTSTVLPASAAASLPPLTIPSFATAPPYFVSMNTSATPTPTPSTAHAFSTTTSPISPNFPPQPDYFSTPPTTAQPPASAHPPLSPTALDPDQQAMLRDLLLEVCQRPSSPTMTPSTVTTDLDALARLLPPPPGSSAGTNARPGAPASMGKNSLAAAMGIQSLATAAAVMPAHESLTADQHGVSDPEIRSVRAPSSIGSVATPASELSLESEGEPVLRLAPKVPQLAGVAKDMLEMRQDVVDVGGSENQDELVSGHAGLVEQPDETRLDSESDPILTLQRISTPLTDPVTPDRAAISHATVERPKAGSVESDTTEVDPDPAADPGADMDVDPQEPSATADPDHSLEVHCLLDQPKAGFIDSDATVFDPNEMADNNMGHQRERTQGNVVALDTGQAKSNQLLSAPQCASPELIDVDAIPSPPPVPLFESRIPPSQSPTNALSSRKLVDMHADKAAEVAISPAMDLSDVKYDQDGDVVMEDVELVVSSLDKQEGSGDAATIPVNVGLHQLTDDSSVQQPTDASALINKPFSVPSSMSPPSTATATSAPPNSQNQSVSLQPKRPINLKSPPPPRPRVALPPPARPPTAPVPPAPHKGKGPGPEKRPSHASDPRGHRHDRPTNNMQEHNHHSARRPDSMAANPPASTRPHPRKPQPAHSVSVTTSVSRSSRASADSAAKKNAPSGSGGGGLFAILGISQAPAPPKHSSPAGTTRPPAKAAQHSIGDKPSKAPSHAIPLIRTTTPPNKSSSTTDSRSSASSSSSSSLVQQKRPSESRNKIHPLPRPKTPVPGDMNPDGEEDGMASIPPNMRFMKRAGSTSSLSSTTSSVHGSGTVPASPLKSAKSAVPPPTRANSLVHQPPPPPIPLGRRSTGVGGAAAHRSSAMLSPASASALTSPSSARHQPMSPSSPLKSPGGAAAMRRRLHHQQPEDEHEAADTDAQQSDRAEQTKKEEARRLARVRMNHKKQVWQEACSAFTELSGKNGNVSTSAGGDGGKVVEKRKHDKRKDGRSGAGGGGANGGGVK
ncbi:hypothetical protein BCR44DRAFT_73054 [Catenaria anguillulae PL171]|uniref:Uncharacterized protein n=1 Tax=Catenaria anguillulae PL171 TaxID=765915 RepID=A0A1Y2I362_9FUNG|nr:hypothetical protein BCR44DRAFT_73054 [Catenaria anguillulae PL171]